MTARHGKSSAPSRVVGRQRKEQAIDLLRRVTTVSVETMKIVKQMP
jgi:hypothetical protein